MKGLAAVLLLAAAPVVAQKPGDQWRTLNELLRADSTVGSVVFYTVMQHEDSTKVGTTGSMPQSAWLMHTKLEIPAPFIGDSARGDSLYKAQCAECHTHKHGWEIREFNIPDTVTLRRTFPHVQQDTQQAYDVLAYLKKLQLSADTMTRYKRPFQPLGIPLDSDTLMGYALFGRDAWSDFASLSRDSLLKIDPRLVPIPLGLPEFANENTLYDWVPGTNQGSGGQLPQGVKAAVQSRFDAYDANPTLGNALAVASALQTAASNVSIPDAPCTFTAQYILRYDPVKCGQIGVYWSLFLYKHSVRFGRVAEDAAAISPKHWEHGHLWHKAQQMSGQGCGVKCDIPDRNRLIAGWIYLGWMWDRALNKNSLYGGGPLGDLGFNRMATWTILRTMVERPTTGNPSLLACADAQNLANSGHVGWMYSQVEYAYDELDYRLAHGMIPAGNKSSCAEYVRQTQLAVGRRAGAAVQAQLQAHADQLRNALLN